VSFDGVIPIGATQTAVKPATINVMPCQALRFTTATLISKLAYSRVLILYIVRPIAAFLMLSGRQPMFFRGHFLEASCFVVGFIARRQAKTARLVQ
jgi:hypothetical protein